MKQFIDFAEKYNITMDVGWINLDTDIEYDADGKKHEWKHNKYHCALRFGKKSLVIPYKQGLGIKHDPQLDEVLYSIQSDAWIAKNNNKFEDFCSEYGYNPDSINTYKACRRMNATLKRFFGYLYDEFMELRDE